MLRVARIGEDVSDAPYMFLPHGKGSARAAALRDVRSRVRRQMEMTRRLVERTRPRGPDRDSGPSR